MSDDDKISVRQTPPEDHEWPYVWDALHKAQVGWRVVRVMVALFDNWKIIGIGVLIGLALGGKEMLAAWGLF